MRFRIMLEKKKKKKKKNKKDEVSRFTGEKNSSK